MAGLSIVTENRIVLLGLGLTTCAVLGVMRQMLIVYRDSVEVHRPPPKTQYITQGTEDSLKPSTLAKLVESHNYGIQEIAARVVCDRALHDKTTLDALLLEVTCPIYPRREQAIRAFNLLSQTSGIIELNTPKVYSALVKCLTYCTAEKVHEVYNPEWDNFDFRDAVERLCLVVLARLTFDFGPEEVIKAGFVQEWLAKEHWGHQPEDVLKNFANSCSKRNNKLSYITRSIAHQALGFRELKNANLISKELELFDDAADVKMVNGEDTAGENRAETGLEGGPRLREHSAEERHLRRRHREAMVLNDGIAPIAVSDIIERDYDSPIEERRSLI